MANKQTRSYHRSGISVLNQGQSPGFATFPQGSQPSKRRQPWQGVKSEKRTIIYPAEFKSRVARS